MNQAISKRAFLTAAVAAIPLTAQNVPIKKEPDWGPAIDGGLVKDFVAAAHGNLEKTQVMQAEKPGFLNATWD